MCSKRVSDLSGGERGRLSLAKLMLSEANFLILDEPTNHLDIASKEILESALNRYEGTVLFVSHDRYFINRTATRILNLTEHSLSITSVIMTIIWRKKRQTSGHIWHLRRRSSSKHEEVSEGKTDWQTQKEEQAKKRKIQNRVKKIEAEIESLEEKLTELDEHFRIRRWRPTLQNLENCTASRWKYRKNWISCTKNGKNWHLIDKKLTK